MEQAVQAARRPHPLRPVHPEGDPDHIKDLVTYRLGDFMFRRATTANLELFRTVRRQSVKGSLFHILDRTVTPMGSRQLRKWIGYPLWTCGRSGSGWRGRGFRGERFSGKRSGASEGILDIERLNARISMEGRMPGIS